MGDGMSGWCDEGGVGSPRGRMTMVGSVVSEAPKSGADRARLWFFEGIRDRWWVSRGALRKFLCLKY